MLLTTVRFLSRCVHGELVNGVTDGSACMTRGIRLRPLLYGALQICHCFTHTGSDTYFSMSHGGVYCGGVTTLPHSSILRKATS
jgi:hypothetical protein